jgi:hypothetical protein
MPQKLDGYSDALRELLRGEKGYRVFHGSITSRGFPLE